MYDVRSSLPRLFIRGERIFRLHLSLEAFKGQSCSDFRPDGKPCRNTATFEREVDVWTQELSLGTTNQVATPKQRTKQINET